MRVVIIDSNSCPLRPHEHPALASAIRRADLVVERFSPFVPFVMKGDAEVVEYRPRWELEDKRWRRLPGVRDREIQNNSNEYVAGAHARMALRGG